MAQFEQLASGTTPEDTRAKFLDWVTTGVGAAIGMWLLATFVGLPAELSYQMGAASMVLLALVARTLGRRGWVDAGGWLLVGSQWGAVSAQLLMDGAASPIKVLWFVTLILAAALIGFRAAVGLALLSAATLWTSFLLESSGHLDPAPLPEQEGILLAWTIQLTVAGVVAGMLAYGFRRALERSNESTRAHQRDREHLARLIRDAPAGIAVVDRRGIIRRANPAVERLTGYPAERLIGMSLEELGDLQGIPTEHRPADWIAYSESASGKPFQYAIARRDGRIVNIEVTTSTVENLDGEPAIEVIARDVTEELRANELEAELQHAHRLESVGRLAGGVAHEFNNDLMVIISTVELAREDPDLPDAVQRDLQTAIDAGQRASNLTRQLLAFARKDHGVREPLDINEMLEGLAAMLDRLLGERVRIKLSLCSKPVPIEGVRGQLEQCIVNLALNAMDAMPRGGVFELATVIEGSEVRIVASDDGVGMAPDVASRVFEPFFTTKEQGRGTGLGLAAVHGIVGQHDGRIDVDSTPDEGTRFVIHLPLATGMTREAAPKLEAPSSPQGETLLVLDDEIPVANALARLLEHAGYEVLVAHDGKTALELARDPNRSIALFIADVVLEGESGPDVARTMAEDRPDLAVLLLSGYPGEYLSDLGFDDRWTLLAKPVFRAELLDAVRSLIEARTPAEAVGLEHS